MVKHETYLSWSPSKTIRLRCRGCDYSRPLGTEVEIKNINALAFQHLLEQISVEMAKAFTIPGSNVDGDIL